MRDENGPDLYRAKYYPTIRLITAQKQRCTSILGFSGLIALAQCALGDDPLEDGDRLAA